ncbi:MAG: UDP-glucose 4-epimerase GalE [Magnetococcales bacterium]|nr:UDP-glucose 4-epimerase GalE [Magnetococcales bacterium]MBF0148982.1 UDP-glucose 4-epimerase GalE [Magnetococcales bacterium]MBF0603048.1 UDP-glucose 4-epimerase GalE [Magnetococcales bacterium]
MNTTEKNNKILVTGGAGYIGSHACKALARAGYLPVVYDDFSTGHRSAVRWGQLEEGSLGDRTRLDEVIQAHRPFAVMHFAAFIEAGESVVDPGKYYMNNTCHALSLLRAMRDHGLERLIFSSTAAVYGDPLQVPITENHPLAPINPYGTSKFMVERILEDFSRAYGLRHVTLRYFNAAGADPEGDCGEDHTPESHLIPLVLQVALGVRPHITLFGNDYATPDGSCIRDYVHVTDLIEAHMLALGALTSGKGSAVYNLGNGRGFSVLEVIEVARRVTGRDISVKIGPRRPGDPSRLIADPGKAKRELGWVLRHDDLAEIIETAWRWILNCPSQLSTGGHGRAATPDDEHVSCVR